MYIIFLRNSPYNIKFKTRLVHLVNDWSRQRVAQLEDDESIQIHNMYKWKKKY